MAFYRISEPDYDTGESLGVLAEIVVDPGDPTQIVDVRGVGPIADMLRNDWGRGWTAQRLLGGFGMKAVEYVEDDDPVKKAHWRLINEVDGVDTGTIYTTDDDDPLLVSHDGENPPIGFRPGMPLREYLAQATQFVLEPINDVAEDIAEPMPPIDLPEVIRATGDAIASVIEAHGNISKIDNEKRHMFGWAYVSHDKDGNVSVDKSGEFVDDYEELEKAAYKFVVHSRQGDMDHTNLKSAEMIESMVFTPEKIEKMGLPAGALPTGWWVGFHIPGDTDWEEAKKRKAFSIHGKGTRKEVDD